jgi:streptogramin lyase
MRRPQATIRSLATRRVAVRQPKRRTPGLEPLESRTLLAITTFPLPDQGIAQQIITGPDGNLWFDVTGSAIGVLNPATDAITEFSVSDPVGIAAGPDGNIWFTSSAIPDLAVGMINPTTGAITEFPNPVAYLPGNITSGPDGDLWFTEQFGNELGRINPQTDVITMVPLPWPAADITTGPDGDLWVTPLVLNSTSNAIASINPTTDAVTVFDTPPGIFPSMITAGPDGNLWITPSGESSNPAVEMFDPQTGAFTNFASPTPDFISIAGGIASGPDGNISITEDGNIWIDQGTDSGTNQGAGGTIAMVNPATGAGTQYDLPNLLDATSITAGPDGKMWFVAQGDGGGYIGVLTSGNDPIPAAPQPVTSLSPAPTAPASPSTTATISPGTPFGFTLTHAGSAHVADTISTGEIALSLTNSPAGASLSVATPHGAARYSGWTFKKLGDGAGYKIMADLARSNPSRGRSAATAAASPRPIITEKLFMSGKGTQKHVRAAELVISKALDPALAQELKDQSAGGRRDAGARIANLFVESSSSSESAEMTLSGNAWVARGGQIVVVARPGPS